MSDPALSSLRAQLLEIASWMGENLEGMEVEIGILRDAAAAIAGPQWQPRAEKAETAIRAFLAQWAVVEPHINGQFVLAQFRSGRQYTGPTIAKELDGLRAVLPDPPPETPQ